MNTLENSLRAPSLTAAPSRPARSWQSAGATRTPAAAGFSRSVRTAFELLSSLRGGSVLVDLPGTQSFALGHGETAAHWQIHDPSLFDRLLAGGDIALGETYMDGLWDSDDPVGLMHLLARNRQSLRQAVYGRPWRMLGPWLRHLRSANTRIGSKRNIAAHYDLGNDFYALWLDPTMSYSSALFERPDEPLRDAQLRKYRRALDRIEARPGQCILEIGCGWGGFAEVAATEYGCRVLGVTLSREQLEFAQQRAQRGGYAGLAQFSLCDYRDVRGRYDHIVSVEMLEAVGERFWPLWFDQVAARLRPGGRALVQTITIDDALFARYRRGTDFIQQYIFPGGMLPSLGAFHRQAKRAGLAVSDDLAFGRDYARTLAHWHRAFLEVSGSVREQGFDPRFVRMWRFYLAYCEAAFRAGDIDVHQFELRHRGAQ